MDWQANHCKRGWKTLCAVFGAGAAFSLAQAEASQISGGTQPETLAISDIDKAKGLNVFDSASFLVVPMPLSNPTTGSGGALVGAMFFKMDEKSKPSTVGLGGFYMSNGSWGGGAMVNLAFAGDRYLAKAMVGYADVNYAFFGIGSAATGNSVKLDQRGGMVKGEFQARVAPNLYVGGSLRYLDLNTTFPDPVLAGTLLGDVIPVPKLENKVFTLALDVTYDSRSSSFSPKSGQLIEGEFGTSGRHFLGNSGYFKGTVAYNRYDSLDDDLVLASRISFCDASGQVPVFDLCMFGASSDLRGYAVGKFQDRAMAAGQVELRWHAFWRIGFVAFAGVGSVGHSVDKFDEALASAGLGIRFLASRDYGVNVGVDGAITRDGDTAVYIQVGEAF